MTREQVREKVAHWEMFVAITDERMIHFSMANTEWKRDLYATNVFWNKYAKRQLKILGAFGYDS